MLKKARRQHQKSRKLIEGEEKRAKRLAKEALAGPAVKKEKVKKERVKKEKVETRKRRKRSSRPRRSLAGKSRKRAARATGKRVRTSLLLNRNEFQAAWAIYTRS